MILMPKEEYIFKEGDKFIIKREIGGKLINFGSFNTLDEAISYRDELDNDGWPIPKNQQDIPIKEEYGKYISKKDGKFIVSRVIRGQEKIFGKFDTLDEAKMFKVKLIDNAWDDILSYEGEYSKFIYKNKHNSFTVYRNMFGKTRYFGSYPTFEEALIAREKLIDDNWGVEGKIFPYDPNEFGEYITYFNEYYRIKNVIDGRSFEFGKFDTLENAIKARDILVENEWDSSKVPDYLYSISFFMNYRPYLYVWEVTNVIDGDLISFGLYDEKEYAERAVEILIENNWDTSFIPFEFYSENSYIYNIYNSYAVIRKVNEEFIYYKWLDTYEDAIYERNKLLLSNWKIKEEDLVEEKQDEHIYLKADGKYYVKYERYGEVFVYGIYDDLIEAVDARFNFVKNAWRDPYLYKEENTNDIRFDISFNDILNIFNSVNIIDEPEVPFPQADNFNEFIDICYLLYEKMFTKEELLSFLNIQPRHYSFHIAAGKYLGLIEKSKKKIHLSREGLILFAKDQQDIYLSLVRLILEHKPFNEVFKLYLSNNEVPSVDKIFEILKECSLENIKSTVTLKRRAGTVRSWINWIVSLYEE